MGYILGMGLGAMLILVIAIALAGYIVMGIYLNKLNEIEYDKKTCFAWIPILNIYLLGKLAINKFFGWIMLLGLFLTGSITTTIDGWSTTKTILPEPIYKIYSIIYSIVTLAFLIVVIVKYYKKRSY